MSKKGRGIFDLIMSNQLAGFCVHFSEREYADCELCESLIGVRSLVIGLARKSLKKHDKSQDRIEEDSAF